MAYYREETIKMSLVCTIQAIANKLNTRVSFDSLDTLSYDDLTSFRDELLEEYNKKIMIKQQRKAI